MSKSKRTARETATPAPRGIQTLFISPRGGLRTLWLLLISLTGYALAAVGLRRGLNAAFAALFRAWRISADNAWRAPLWARSIYRWHGSAVTAIVSAALLLLCVPLRRLWRSGIGGMEPAARRERIESPRGCCAALSRWGLTGLGTALGVAALCLIPDSVRSAWPLTAPRLTWSLIPLCAISLLAALCEEAFLKGVLLDGLRGRWGGAWATAVACGMFFLLNGGYAGNVLSGVNVLLLGLLCCALYERHGLFAAAGFRWGWSAATVFLLGFGGGDAAVYRLYGVSERLLTGGDAGPVYGLWATLALAGGLIWMEREKIAGRVQGRYTRRTREITRTSKGRFS